MEKQQYVCEKCGNMHYVSDQFQATGGNFAKIFDVQNKNLLQLAVPNAATPNFTAPNKRRHECPRLLLGGVKNECIFAFVFVNRRLGKCVINNYAL